MYPTVPKIVTAIRAANAQPIRPRLLAGRLPNSSERAQKLGVGLLTPPSSSPGGQRRRAMDL